MNLLSFKHIYKYEYKWVFNKLIYIKKIHTSLVLLTWTIPNSTDLVFNDNGYATSPFKYNVYTSWLVPISMKKSTVSLNFPYKVI